MTDELVDYVTGSTDPQADRLAAALQRAEHAEELVMDLTRRAASSRDSVIRLRDKTRLLKARVEELEAELKAEREGRVRDARDAAARQQGFLDAVRALNAPLWTSVDPCVLGVDYAPRASDPARPDRAPDFTFDLVDDGA